MAIAGANGRQDVCGGGIERAARVRVETDAPCGAASAPLAQLAAARVGDVLYLEEKILASRISNGNNVKKNHARTPRGKRRRVIACGDAFAELPRSVAAAAIVPFEDGLRGEGGKLVPLNCGEMRPHAPCGLFALAPPSPTYP